MDKLEIEYGEGEDHPPKIICAQNNTLKEETITTTKRPIPWAGIVSVLGGTLVHLTLGTMYCWGNFISYLPPSMQFFSFTPEEQYDDTPDALYVLSVTMLFQCISMPLSSSILQERIGLRPTMLLGSVLMTGGVFVSSFVQSLEAFLFYYCILFGTGVGIVYTAPIVAGWMWFPNRKGLVSGAILAGYGSGGFVFNLIGTAIVNPERMSVSDEYGGKFPDGVYARFPLMLRCLAGIYIVLQLIGAVCVRKPEEKKVPMARSVDRSCETLREVADEDGARFTVMTAVRTKNFWVLWSCMVLSATAGLNVLSVYKMYGNQFEILNDDTYLSIVGGCGSIANGVGRTFWGMSQDAFGFQTPFRILTFSQALIMILYHGLTGSKPVFGMATFLVHLCLGGNFAMAPGACAKLFGTEVGPKVFSVLFSAFATAAVVGSVVNRVLLSNLGFDAVFAVMAGFSVVSGGLVSALDGI